MVAWTFVFTGQFVNHASRGLRFQGISDQDVIDAQASVSAKTKVAIVPPTEAFFRLFEQPETVVQTKINQAIQMRALFGRSVNGAGQGHRVPPIQIVKGDVVVAHERQLGMLCHFFFDPISEGF